VWSLLEDWEGSAAWMVDATTVDVLEGPRRGVGTRIKAVTKIAGVPLTDLMEVVGWDDERSITVMHHGWPIRGIAWFELRPAKDGGTWFEWAEELDPHLAIAFYNHSIASGSVFLTSIERPARVWRSTDWCSMPWSPCARDQSSERKRRTSGSLGGRPRFNLLDPAFFCRQHRSTRDACP